MNTTELYSEIVKKGSFLCVGLDTDMRKIPAHLLDAEDPIFEFNRAIIDATAPYCVCYKPNTAFYEAHGVAGWIALEKSVKYIKEHYPEILVIMDAKRGDIGNTCDMYARAFFEQMNADAITVAPYMGRDSVEPFLKYEGKWSVVLALTSNGSSEDFENQAMLSGEKLYERVLSVSREWGTDQNMMYVVGATKATALEQIRSIVPNHFLLVPGVGAQGGSLEEVAKYGMNSQCGLLVNSSRGIIYASQGEDFAEKAAQEAQKLQQQMSQLL
ncbi:MAG: orotidine-5'-phosphate decarboxylase [Rikenellaceae bacterium]